jgi:hypothetical protein
MLMFIHSLTRIVPVDGQALASTLYVDVYSFTNTYCTCGWTSTCKYIVCWCYDQLYLFIYKTHVEVNKWEKSLMVTFFFQNQFFLGCRAKKQKQTDNFYEWSWISVSDPTSLCYFSLILYAKRRINKYYFYSLWFDPIDTRTYDLPHLRRAR